MFVFVTGGLGALASPGLASLLGSGGPASSSSASRFLYLNDDAFLAKYTSVIVSVTVVLT